MTILELTPDSVVKVSRGVIKVGATWCEACVDSDSAYKRYAKRLSKRCHFYSMDLDVFKTGRAATPQVQNIIDSIEGVPAFYFYKHGKLIHTMIGYTEDKFKAYLRRVCRSRKDTVRKETGLAEVPSYHKGKISRETSHKTSRGHRRHDKD